ncbi:AAA family ATPase [Devosia sp. D6-9]|nr:AAA family ATPase [Devosia sp. D6-9]
MISMTTVPSSAFVDRIRKLRSAERQSVSTVMTTVRAAYFGTDTDTELDAAIDDMFDDVVETLEASATPGKDSNHIGRMSEGYPLLGLGVSGTRKTSTFARMIHRRKEFEGFSYVPHLNTSPLISVKAPSPCTLRILGITIARGMGLVVGENMAENEVWNHIIDNLPIRDVRFIHIDEFQHVMENRNSLDIAKITNAMKRLVQTPEHPVWLLVTGMPEVGIPFEGETQLWRRKSYVLFEEMTFERHADICLEMINFFATEKANLQHDAFLVPENVQRLMHASLFRLGIAIDVVIKGIRVALKEQATSLSIEHLATAYKAFTGCQASANPFLVRENFSSIEVDKYLTRLLESGKAEAGAKAKGGKA